MTPLHKCGFPSISTPWYGTQTKGYLYRNKILTGGILSFGREGVGFLQADLFWVCGSDPGACTAAHVKAPRLMFSHEDSSLFVGNPHQRHHATGFCKSRISSNLGNQPTNQPTKRNTPQPSPFSARFALPSHICLMLQLCLLVICFQLTAPAAGVVSHCVTSRVAGLLPLFGPGPF